ncbi:MAG: spore coat protein YsxE [Sporolactobacillus sp.]
MTGDQDAPIKRLLFEYDLLPLQIIRYGKLYRIETPGGSFALKSKSINHTIVDRLRVAYRLSAKLMIDALCPLPSKYGDLVIEQQNGIGSYLLPWIEETVAADDLHSRYARLFLKTGQMHRQTLDGEEEAQLVYQAMAERLPDRLGIWETFVSAAEHHLYPSPFEQLVLEASGGYLTDLQRAMTFFREALQPKESDEQVDKRVLRRAFCHGRLSPLHVLIDHEKSYFINFEHSSYGPCVIEAAALFEQACAVQPADQKEWGEWINAYLSACPLNDEETAFLFHYLISPRAPTDLLAQYMNAHDESELWFTKRWMKLQRAQTAMLEAFRDYFNRKQQTNAEQEQTEQKK